MPCTSGKADRSNPLRRRLKDGVVSIKSSGQDDFLGGVGMGKIHLRSIAVLILAAGEWVSLYDILTLLSEWGSIGNILTLNSPVP